MAKTKVIRRYIRPKKKSHRRHGFTVPVSVVAGFTPGLARLVTHFSNPSLHGAANGIEAVGIEASRIYLGYDPRDGSWNGALMMLGIMPLVLGGLVHKFIGGTLGVNRMIARAGIPVIRL